MLGLDKKINYAAILRDFDMEIINAEDPCNKNKTAGFRAYVKGVPVAIFNKEKKRLTVTKKQLLPVFENVRQTLESHFNEQYVVILFHTDDNKKYTQGIHTNTLVQKVAQPSQIRFRDLVPNWAYNAFNAFRAYVPVLVPEKEQ